MDVSTQGRYTDSVVGEGGMSTGQDCLLQIISEMGLIMIKEEEEENSSSYLISVVQDRHCSGNGCIHFYTTFILQGKKKTRNLTRTVVPRYSSEGDDVLWTTCSWSVRTERI